MNANVHHFTAADGIDLAWHELGDGRPVVLLHGLFSDAFTNWLRYGHAAAIAARGFRVIMPDLRAHGQSGKPHDPAFYPPDILASDGLALIAHLGLEDYDLGGYSLGARTSVRMVVLGAAPKKLIVGGMGLTGLHSTGRRSGHFKRILTGLGSFERGTPEWLAYWMERVDRILNDEDPALIPLEVIDAMLAIETEATGRQCAIGGLPAYR